MPNDISEACAQLIAVSTCDVMPQMTGRMPLVGLWSYVASDDTESRGHLAELRRRLQGDLQIAVGSSETVYMLQSTAFIPHGPYWMGEINRAVNEATFLLPIITPAFLQSEWCCHEVRIFLDREARLGREDLIFPISYLDALDMPEDECAYPDLVKLLRGRPRADFRVLQQLGAFSPGVVVRIKQLATSIYAALRGQRAFAPTQVIINVERNKPERPPIPRVFRAGDPVD